MKNLKGIIKVAGFAAVVLCSLFIVQWYQLKCMAHLQEEVYVVDSSEVAKNLIKGTQPDSLSYALKKVEADEPVYRRGFDLYVGQGKDKIEKDFPFYANDGNAVMIMADDPVLLDTQFQETETFQGMYVSDGLTFNFDKTQADEDSFLFLKLDNGLFMNTQGILFEYPGGSSQVRMNSIFYMGVDGVRYYSILNDHSLQYSALPTTKLMKVTIGGETYSYEQLLELLGVSKKSKNVMPKPETETEPETFPEIEKEREVASGGDLVDEEQKAESSDTSTEAGESEAGENAAAGQNAEAQYGARPDSYVADKDADGWNRSDDGFGNGEKDRWENSDWGDGDSGWSNSGWGDNGSGWGDNGDGGSGDGGSGWGDSGNGGSGSGSGGSGSGSGNSGSGSGGSGSGSGNSGSGSGGSRSGSGSSGSGSGGSGSGSGNSGSGSGGSCSGSGCSGSGSGGSGSGSGGSGSGSEESSSGSGDSGSSTEASTESGGSNIPGESGSDGEYVEPSDGEEGTTGSSSGEGGGNVNIPFRYPTAYLGMFTTDVYNVSSTLTIKDPALVSKRVVIELYWQPENEDGTAKPDSDKQDDYQLMYRKTFRGDGEVRIDNLPPNTTMYARGLIYYMKDGKTEHQVFYEGFDSRFKTLSLDYVDDLYVEFKPSAPDMKLLPNQMQIFEFAVSGPNANVVDKIGKIQIDLVAKTGEKKGNSYRLQMGLTDARNSYYYTEKAEERPVWVSDTKQLYLPADTEYDYEIKLLDPFGNPFTRVVEGYMANTIDQEENKSLNCCSKLEQYYQPAGSTRTAKVIPKVSMTQKGWTDGRKNIDRVAYEIAFNDANKAISGYEDSYWLEIIQDGDKTNTPVPFKTSEEGEPVTRIPITKECLQGEVERYELWGLTAGHIYQVNIYGDYNLNDNQPVYEKQLIGSQRFSTISMGSYGRVSYDLYSSHVKTNVWPNGEKKDEVSPYESATAQKVTMSINFTQTNRELVDLYMNHVILNVTETQSGRSILQTVLTRKTMESDALKVSGTGTGDRVEFELNPEDLMPDAKSTLKDGYLPRVILETEDFAAAEERTMWEVFTNPSNNAKLIFYWEDGTLNSITGYQFSTSTYASQGGEIHDVTGRSAAYRRLLFTTLKKMPYVTCEDVLLVSNYIKLYNLDFHDVDHAITDGSVAAALVGIKNLDLTLDYDETEGGFVKELLFDKLTIGKNYQISLAPYTIKRDAAGLYTLRSESLFAYNFTAGDGLSGRLIFESINYPLENRDGDKETVSLKSEYSLYNASGYDTGYLNTSGGVTETSSGINNTWDWTTSPHIQVTPGDVYYISGARESDTATTYLCFYYADGSVATIDYFTWKPVETVPANTGNKINRFNINGANSVIRVPEGVATMRFSMYGSIDSITSYATANCFYLTKAEAAEEAGTLTETYDVKPGEKYAIAQGYNRYTITFKKKDGTVSVLDYNQQLGRMIEVPAGAEKMSFEKVYGMTTLENSILYKLDLENLDWLESKDLSRFANSVTLKVEDPLNNLILENDNKIYLDVYQDGKLLTGKNDPIPQEVRDKLYLKVTESGNLTMTENLQLLASFIGDANKTFDLELYVKYRGEKIVLDTINFKTNRVMEVIHDRTELAKLMRYRYGDFMVVEDIYLRDNESFYFSENTPFQGNIDFQGHTLKMYNTKSGVYGINTIGGNAAIKNLVLDMTIASEVNKTVISNVRGLAYKNYGTIQNVVVNLDLGQGMYRKTDISGLVENNYGRIENFNVNFSASSTNYVGRTFGGLVRSNTGEIRNGYVYSPGPLNATTGVFGGTTTINNDYTGFVTAINSGTIENVYVVGSMAVEKYGSSGTLSTNALISGSRGSIRNCFTVGELMRTIWTEENTREVEAYNTYGPAIPGYIDASTAEVENNYFFSSSTLAFTRNIKGRQEKAADVTILQDPSFYDRTVNQADAFYMEDISDGYFPRLQMSEEMMDKQMKVALSSAGVDNSIKFLSAVIDEQHERGDVLEDGTVVAEDYALATLAFNNRLERKINAIKINGLRVEPQSGTEYEQYADDAFYRVKVKLLPDNVYSDTYEVAEFTYNNTYTTTVEGREILVTFSKEVTQDNWCTAFDNPASYYRLGEDIDYSKFPENQKEQAAAAMQFKAAFTGSLDGKGHSLKNFRFETMPYLIPKMAGGNLHDLIVDGMVIDGSKANSSYSGLIGQTSANTNLKGIVIKNSQINGIYQYAGGLVGYGLHAVIEDCVVSGLSMESDSDGRSLQVGGLVGAMANTRMENCFVRKLEIFCKEGQSAEGIGGLVGYQPNGSTVRNCYAQGSIDSAFSRTGGVAGYLNGMMISTWSKVNMNTTAPYVGGISGIVDTSTVLNQALALGEVFTTASDKYGRIVGGFLGAEKELARCYAAADQKINSQVLEDLMDAEGLLTEDELKLERYYWNTCNIGEAFDYSHLEEGYLPFLYNKAGTELLPEQDYASGISISTAGLEFTARGTAEDKYQTVGGVETFDYNLEVAITFKTKDLKDEASFAQNYEKYFGTYYENISIENMELAKENGKIKAPIRTYGEDSTDGTPTCTLTFTDVKALRYLDSYRVVLQTEETGKIGVKLSFYEKKDGIVYGTEIPLYRHIYRVLEDNSLTISGGHDLNSWQGAMAAAGDTYENFLIMKNLDFTPVSSADLRTGLKINRLEGNENRVTYDGAGHTEITRKEYLMADPDQPTPYVAISNVNFTEEKVSGVNWIYELRSEMKYLRFSDIRWTSSPSGSYVGILRLQTGAVSYVDIERVTIDFGSATSYIGFITNTNNTMEYVRGRDIQIKTSALSTAKTRVDYVGGITAYSKALLQHIGIKGTSIDGNWSYSITGSDNNAGNSGTYTGGIVGYAMDPGVAFIYADTVQVNGNQYVGPLAGYMYSLAVQWKYSEAMYNALQIEGKDKVYLAAAENCDANGRSYVGGVYGNSNYAKFSLSKGNKVHAVLQGAGGFCGSAGGTYLTVIGCDVECDGDYASGISGYYGWYNFNYCRVTGCNIKAKNYAGGILGRNLAVTLGYDLVEDCAIYADNYAGGICGVRDAEVSSVLVYRSMVKDCKIGSTTTHYPLAQPDGNGGYEAVWMEGSGSGTNYAGGMAGVSYGQNYHHNVLDNVEVRARNYAGGLYGRGGGGTSYDMEIDAEVTAEVNYAGSYAGELIGYAESIAGANLLQRPATKVDRVILTGTVKGNAAVGGFAGSYVAGNRPRDNDTGEFIRDEESGYKEILSKEYFKRIVMAQTSIDGGNANQTGLITQNMKQAGGETGINYLRIYNGLQYNNTPITSAGVISAYPNWQYEDSTKTAEAYKEPFYVSPDDMKDIHFYYGNLDKGGLYLREDTTAYLDNKGAYVNTGRYYNFYYSDDVKNKSVFPYVTIEVTSTQLVGYWFDPANQIQKGIPIPDGTSGASTLSLGDLSDSLDAVSIYASGAGTINLEFPVDLADLGADVIEARELAKTEPEILEGIILPEVQFEILGSDGALIEQKEIDRQTYTIPYDFDSTLTIRVTLGENSRSFAVTGDGVRRTVMTWKDHCYYIRKDGIYSDNGAYSGDGSMANVQKVLSGSFINLYQGEALDSDGDLYRVASGAQTDALDPETLFKVSEETVPAYRTDYSGEEVLSYRTYSMVDHGETRSDYRLFAKNGKLFGMDPQLDQPYGQGFQSFLADYYSTSQGSTEYLSIVTENRVLEDRKAAIRWPKDENQKDILDNFQILEIGDNLYADEPYVIIRYCDNTTAAFNYLTGTLLFKDDSEKEALGFADYASLWASGKKVALKTMNAYNSAAGLVDSLSKNPIDDNQVIGFIKKTDAPENTADSNGNKLDVAIDGDNKVGGSNSTGGTSTSGGSGGSDQGTETDGTLTENDTKGPESGADGGSQNGESGKPSDGDEGAAGENGEKADADKTGTGTGQGSDADKTGNENDRDEDADEAGTDPNGTGQSDGTGNGQAADAEKTGDGEKQSDSKNDSDGVTGENTGAGTENADDGSVQEPGHETGEDKSGNGQDADKAGAESEGGEAGDGQDAEKAGAESEGGKAEDGQDAEKAGAESEDGKTGDGQKAAGAKAESESGKTGDGQTADSQNQAAGSKADRNDRAESSDRADRAEGSGAEGSREGGTARVDGSALISKLESKDVGAGEVNTAGSATGEGAGTEPGEAKAVLPSLTSDRAYVTMLTADAGGYEVFRAEDLLTKGGESLISENRKMEIMEENGIRQNAINLEAMKVSAETNRTGLALVGAAAACMVILLGVLYDKKKRMSKQE